MRIYSEEDCIRAQNGTECINCGDCKCSECGEPELFCTCCDGYCEHCEDPCLCETCDEPHTACECEEE